MHSGVYSKSETPVNRTLTSNPVESLGRTVMVSLMFWWEKKQGGVAGEGFGTPSLADQVYQCSLRWGGSIFVLGDRRPHSSPAGS